MSTPISRLQHLALLGDAEAFAEYARQMDRRGMWRCVTHPSERCAGGKDERIAEDQLEGWARDLLSEFGDVRLALPDSEGHRVCWAGDVALGWVCIGGDGVPIWWPRTFLARGAPVTPPRTATGFTRSLLFGAQSPWFTDRGPLSWCRLGAEDPDHLHGYDPLLGYDPLHRCQPYASGLGL